MSIELNTDFSEEQNIQELQQNHGILNPADISQMWSILLNYLQNEETKLGHSGFRQSDIIEDTIWNKLDKHIDLSDEFFRDICNDIRNVVNNSSIYVESLGILNDAELALRIQQDYNDEMNKLFWNESVNNLLRTFLMTDIYEDIGDLIELDNGTIDDKYLRGTIQIKNGYSFRVKDIKQADAGANFVIEKDIYTNLKQYVIYNFSEIKREKVDDIYVYSGDIKGIYIILKDDKKIKEYSYDIAAKDINKLRDENGNFTNKNYTILANGNAQSLQEFLDKDSCYDSDGNRKQDKDSCELVSKIKTLKAVINPWVIPWYNINGHSYKYVRGADRINGVLADSRRLDFTVSQSKENRTNQWLRLLMPQNKRRVEIEDLNRNFWVIGQVASAVSAYLFDEESPFAKILGGLLNEIMQLWENVLYLWTSLAAASNPYYNKIHKEVIYLYNNEGQNYFKYDDFDFDNLTEDNVKKIVNPYLDKYKNSNICLIIAERDNNYEYNYYTTERYLGAYLLDRNKKIDDENREKWISFKDKTENYQEFNLTNSNILNILTSLRQDGDKYYTLGAIEKVGMTTELSSNKYYGLVRPIYNINVIIDSDKNLKLNKFEIKYYDVGYEIFNNQKNICALYTFRIEEDNEINFSSSLFEQKIIFSDSKIISEGFYQGELLSNSLSTKMVELTVNTWPIRGFPRNIKNLEQHIFNDHFITAEEVIANYGGINGTDMNLLKLMPKERNKIYLRTVIHDNVYFSPSSEHYRATYEFYNLTNNEINKVEVKSEDGWTYPDNTPAYVHGTYGGTTVLTAAQIYCLINEQEILNIYYPNYNWSQGPSDAYWKNANGDFEDIEFRNDYGESLYSSGYPVYKTYLKKKDNKLKVDNWVFEEIRTISLAVQSDKEDFNNYVWYGGSQAYAVMQIIVTLFYPNGDMYRRIYTRETDNGRTIVNSYLFNCEDIYWPKGTDYLIEKDFTYKFHPIGSIGENFVLNHIDGKVELSDYANWS